MEAEHAPTTLAWYGMLQAHTRSFEAIEREVESGTGLALSWFELLAQLRWREDGRARMSELADDLLLSRGGTTRLVARLEEAGLVRREIPPEDRRATYAVITDEGRARVDRALPLQAEAVHRHFGRFLDDDELAQFAAACAKVLRGIDASCEGLIAKMEQLGARQR